MAYVSQGRVVQKRSPWRLSFLVELFWMVIDFLAIFFRTIISPEAHEAAKSSRPPPRSYTSGSSGSGGGGPGGPGGPRPRIVGVDRLTKDANHVGPGCGGGG
jgi:hypothetical protein